MPKFVKTAEALKAYDAADKVVTELFGLARSNVDVHFANLVQEGAKRQVQAAFYLDTKDYNRMDSVLGIEIAFMRTCVERDK